MACYFGCGTPGNRVAYVFYLLFIAIGAGLVIYWGADAGRCLATEDVSLACESYETVQPGHDGDEIGSMNWTLVTAAWPYPYAENETEWSLCTTAGLNYTYDWWHTEHHEFGNCIQCQDMITECMIRDWPFLLAGMLLLLLACIPCAFFCCCSKPPAGYNSKNTI